MPAWLLLLVGCTGMLVGTIWFAVEAARLTVAARSRTLAVLAQFR
jgi:hypothetical protein